MLCHSLRYFLRHKKVASGSISCAFASIVNIFIGKDDEYPPPHDKLNVQGP